ncbi:hypothetical protein [Streptomyces sp. NRRL B-24484]|uniref:hypothetical protein n=1 Tax=Streptomyces sp. NRRL B-24484 TaxID=1463833 RepID=UPI0005BA87B1|nr:hypothetical protein [Streptomyces sp. NRRL B-24484]
MSEKSRRAAPDASPPVEPASFLAAASALGAIGDAVRTAQNPASQTPTAPDTQEGPEQALAALLLLRELRTQLAGWEAGLVETAREAGATWADLARPMGVASRQAAENRYLRLKPDLVAPLNAMRPHLGPAHTDLATRLDDLTHHTDRLRHDSDQRRA